MLGFSSSLVAQLPFSSSCVASQSGLAALIPRTRTPSPVLQLLRGIDSADWGDFVSDGWWWFRKHRGSCCSSSYASTSPRNCSATLQSAGRSSSSRIPGCRTANWIHRNAEDLAVLLCRGRHTGPLLPQRKSDLSKPELWSFHHWFPRGLSGIHRGGIAFRVTVKMTSVASRAGGRQLRERKGTHISLSTPAIGRKKGVVRETTSTDDEMELRRGIEVSAAAQDFEARLWDLDKSNKLTTLTVLELRGYMKLMSKPTAGRKDELISTVKEWLANREISTSAKAKQAQAIQETSSDAESLEGALLKAENKNREAEAEATSRRTEILPARKVNKKQKDAVVPTPVLEQEVEEPTAPKRKAGDTATSTKKKLSKNSKELDGTPDEQISAKVVTKRKNQSSNVAKLNDVGIVVVNEDEGKRRKLEQIANVQEETAIKIVVEKVVEINVDTKKPWLLLAHKKPKSDWVVYDPETIRPPALPSSVKSVKLLSWNVNGLRALLKAHEKKSQELSLLTQLAEEEDFDILCLQETKLQDKDLEQLSSSLLPNYTNKFWSCSTAKLGYSGTAIISRVKPLCVTYGMGNPDHDNEGRLITAEFDNFYLVTSYVPNAGAELARLSYRTEEWDPALSQYLKELEKNKPVIYTGDLNCANEEIDVSNPDGNRKSAGFTSEERESFKTNFLNKGLVDTFRQQHPNVLGYTYWGYRSGARSKNNGWRLDYFMVSESFMNQIHDSYIRPDIMGSDHCPIGLIVKE